MFYLISYGGHINILEFFIRNNLLTSALRYIQIKHLDAKIFIHYIFLPHLKRGDIATIINELTEMDKTLGMWKETIIQTCLYLEIKKLYNSLYQMQVLLKDVVRAAMTCVRFYSMNCANFTDLHNHTIHLTNAQSHLQTELEKCYFDVKETRRKSNDLEKSLFMKMDLKMINGHINTISRQIEVVKFLAACEKCGKQTLELLPKVCQFKFLFGINNVYNILNRFLWENYHYLHFLAIPK